MPLDTRTYTYHFWVSGERKDELLEMVKDFLQDKELSVADLDALSVWFALAAAEAAKKEESA